jgi:hypothetical protein
VRENSACERPDAFPRNKLDPHSNVLIKDGKIFSERMEGQVFGDESLRVVLHFVHEGKKEPNILKRNPFISAAHAQETSPLAGNSWISGRLKWLDCFMRV